ncbi:MAG: aminoglycoside phosphotransferase family protein [Chloroflexota bacterium]|nr:MAG: phosphotransferase [Chloroflexota bacterium]
MLEKPNISDEMIIACLHDDYGLQVADLAFLPLGADASTAVYRAVTGDAPYFVKLRRGAFDETTVLVPRLLYDRGMAQVIPPLPARTGRLWARLGDYTVIVAPFVAGQSGFEKPLLDRHWTELGRALKRLHTTTLPPELLARIPQERYSGEWRERVRSFQTLVQTQTFHEPVAAALAEFMTTQQEIIGEIVWRAERLASVLRGRPQHRVLCHADIHAGNVHIDEHNTLYIVDWDTLTLAPKERDLMFAGAGLGDGSRSAEDEERLFYQGYGDTEIDWVALAYYRFERIVQDIAEFAAQLLSTEEGGADREHSLRLFMGQFLPGQVVEQAFRAEERLPGELRSG